MGNGKRKNGNGYNSKHRNGKISKLEIGANDLHLINYSRDGEQRRFLHYCSFSRHKGIIGIVKAKRCLRKRCRYYRRFYEEIKPNCN